jgi:beta-carotene hydroxylase
MNNWRDWQSVAYLLALPALVVWAWVQPTFHPVIYSVILVLTIGICCINHNHAHVPIWRARWANRVTDLWIGTLQGQPVYLFLPAHINSHHRFNQGEQDLTRVRRHATDNTMLGYLLFPFQVLPALGRLRREYLASLWRDARPEYWRVMALHLPLIALWPGGLLLDPAKALVYVIAPHVIGLHFLLASNYLQHAHVAEGSRFNHSRNFVGFANRIWFNVGYHTAHHEHEVLHWTLLPAAHRRMAGHIAPALVERSLFRYYVLTLMLGQLIPKFRSRPFHD